MLNLSFQNASQMYRMIKEKLPQGPKWQQHLVTLDDAPNNPQTLYFCNVVKCAMYLARNPAFKSHMDYEPKKVFLLDGQQYVCVFNEMSTGDMWMKLQVRSTQYQMISDQLIAHIA